MAQLINQLNRH